MNEAKHTWALVVGIDRYDLADLPPLDGAVADAVEAVKWLRRLGVEDRRILVHASPSSRSRRKLEALGLKRPDAFRRRKPYLPATEEAIWSSVNALSGVPDGKRLFVFLSGHGLYEPAWKRLFLTQDFGVNEMWGKNWGIDKYCDHFLSMSFERQFLFMDGCLNFPYATTVRTKIPAGFPGPTDATPRQGNSLVTCFGASMGERAAEIDGRGAFMRVLLESMDVERPLPRAESFDFDTGETTLDLMRLFDYVKRTVQADAADQTPRLDQTPQVFPLGRAAGTEGWPLFTNPYVSTRLVELDLNPRTAAPEVEEIRVFCRDRDWVLHLPRGKSLELPWPTRLPPLRTAAACSVRPEASWQVLQAERDILETDTKLVFDLSPSGPPPTPAQPLVFSVKTTDAEGYPVSAMENLYGRISKKLGLPKVGWERTTIQPGVTVEPHEDGPEFLVRPSAAQNASEIVGRWAELARKLTPDDVAVSTIVSAAEPVAPANLRIRLPRGGARALVGVLEEEVLSVGPPGPADGAVRTLSLQEVESAPDLRLAPGPTEVLLRVPWGSWSTVVSVPATGQVEVELPDSVGTPPFRVGLRGELGRRGFRILGVSGDRPRGSVRRGLLATEGHPLVADKRGTAAWALALSGGFLRWIETGAPIAVLETGSRALFPLHRRRPMAVEVSAGGLRVEPLSRAVVPEWDLLVTSGQLEALSLKDVDVLARQKWVDELLGLAAAYALYGSRSWSPLQVVLHNLQTRLRLRALDVDLLAAAVRDRTRKTLSDQSLARLLPHARRGAVPLMRWGVRLALELLLGRPDDPRLLPWREALEAVERNLSAISVWTAWTE